MKYVQLPPPRGSLFHEKLLAMVIAITFGAGAIAAARSYDRPGPVTARAARSACDLRASFVALPSLEPTFRGLARERPQP